MIAGHSLGGAMAVVAALDLAEGSTTPEVITFGCPRVGSIEFSWLFHQRKIGIRRFVHAQDGVTVSPPWGLYLPIGIPLRLGGTAQPAPPPPMGWVGGPSQSGTTTFQQLFPLALQIIHPALGHVFWSNRDACKFMDPSQTSLGRLALGPAGLLLKVAFWMLLTPLLLCLIAVLAHPVATSDLARQGLSQYRCVRWLATGGLMFAVQQVAYGLAWGCPTWLRASLSAAVLVWLAMHVTAGAFAFGLIFLTIVLLLAAYRCLGGSTDHSMAFYVRALGAKPVRE